MAKNNIFKIVDDMKKSEEESVKFLMGEIRQITRSRKRKNSGLEFDPEDNDNDTEGYNSDYNPWSSLSHVKLSNIEEILKKRVKGQDEAVKKVKSVIIRSYTGFSGLLHSKKSKKPKGILFFVGPTGVGKTELAKAVAEFLFDDEDAFIRFDMSEFSQDHSEMRLIGAPPSYIGYENGGELTEAVKEKPFSVILFDEIEKAHPRILDKFLQILEDGRLTDGHGETVSFADTLIIFTSNIGTAKINDMSDKEKTRQQFLDAVKEKFYEIERPELLNRIGENNIVAFNFITDKNVMIDIGKCKFEPFIKLVKLKYWADLVFEDEEKIWSHIVHKASAVYGGRGILNIIEAEIIDSLAVFVFENNKKLLNNKLIISLDENKNFLFRIEKKSNS